MALEPRHMSRNHSKSGSKHINSANLLRKLGSNVSADIWSETPLWKQKKKQSSSKLGWKQSRGLPTPVSYPNYMVIHMHICFICAFLTNTPQSK